jgi:hypothetical protein
LSFRCFDFQAIDFLDIAFTPFSGWIASRLIFSPMSQLPPAGFAAIEAFATSQTLDNIENIFFDEFSDAAISPPFLSDYCFRHFHSASIYELKPPPVFAFSR